MSAGLPGRRRPHHPSPGAESLPIPDSKALGPTARRGHLGAGSSSWILGRTAGEEEGAGKGALGVPHPLLTTDVFAQNALGLLHGCLQTKYWLLEGQKGEPESQRVLGFPAAAPGWSWTRVTSSFWTRCSICWCSSGGMWKAWWGRSVGGAGHGAGDRELRGGGGRSAGAAGPHSPPAGRTGAPRPRARGWAQAAPGGAGRCRELPRRAGPAETRQGHLGNPRPPPAR